MEFLNGRIMDDVLDSRDVVDAARDIANEWGAYKYLDAVDHVSLPDEDRAILNLDRAGCCALGDEDWENGVTLIRDSYFTEYAQELADDLGVLPKLYEWPISCIDWEQAAEELQMDYTPLEVDGVTWWGRP